MKKYLFLIIILTVIFSGCSDNSISESKCEKLGGEIVLNNIENTSVCKANQEDFGKVTGVLCDCRCCVPN